MDKCIVCNNTSNLRTIGEKYICMDCYQKQRRQEILEKASHIDDCSLFKTWSSEDLTTAFFETFGRYVKTPNEKDFWTIYEIWLWSVHANKALVETIKYTFQWANLSIHKEYRKWKGKQK